MGGFRSGPTGKDSPDVSGLAVSPECKYMKRLGVRKSHILQANANALVGKPWILCLKEHGQRGFYVLCDGEHYADLYRRAYPAEENTLD